MKKLLVVSYDSPPSSIGIWRTLKFCRYMVEFGWKPYILTVKPVRSPRYDLSPLKELPAETEIRRTESLDQNRIAWLAAKAKGALRRKGSTSKTSGAPQTSSTHAGFRRIMDVFRAWVLIPDDRAGWYPFAVREGRRWMREQEFDAVYTTCFPATSFLVGARLAREFGKPLIMDYRDIWIGNYYFYKPATRWHDRRQRKLEKETVRQADAVLTVNRQIADDIVGRNGRAISQKVSVIPNGFDPVDFQFPDPKPDTSVYTITFTGTLYGSTTPQYLFRAIKALLKKEPRWKRVLRLRFVGAMIEPYRDMIHRFGLEEITTTEPYLAHDEALRAMAEADALLLLVADEPGSHIMLTQKVFEYAAARRPVLGLVPDGAARDFLMELNEGPIVYTKDVRAIARAIRGLLREWEREGRKALPVNPVLARYERRHLTEQLCKVLDQATAES